MVIIFWRLITVLSIVQYLSAACLFGSLASDQMAAMNDCPVNVLVSSPFHPRFPLLTLVVNYMVIVLSLADHLRSQTGPDRDGALLTLIFHSTLIEQRYDSIFEGPSEDYFECLDDRRL